MKLGNIASIQTGLYAKPNAEGQVVYLQANYFDQEGNLSAKLHPDLMEAEISPKHFLKPGDLLFAAKGFKNFAAVFESHNQPAVASTSFFVIRLNETGILPHYLAWFMNHSVTQNLLKANAHGTAMASISKAFLLDLDIPIPSLEAQKLVLKISELRKRERQLIDQLDELREHEIQQNLLNTVNKNVIK